MYRPGTYIEVWGYGQGRVISAELIERCWRILAVVASGQRVWTEYAA